MNIGLGVIILFAMLVLSFITSFLNKKADPPLGME